MNSIRSLIPLRFIITTGHLLSVLMIFYTKSRNIATALPASDHTDYQTLKSAYEVSMTTAWVMALCCFIVDYVCLFGGITLFSPKQSVFQIICHFFGSLYVCWTISSNWHFMYFWYTVLLTNIPTGISSLIMCNKSCVIY